MSEIGKIVGEALYIHKCAVDAIDYGKRLILSRALDLLDKNIPYNVIKFDLAAENRISLLEYTSFETDPFPVLLSSVIIDLLTGDKKFRTYSLSNPPILHRKELLLPKDYPNRKEFENLTSELEALGAFENIVELGTKAKWENELNQLGIKIKEHSISSDLIETNSSADVTVFRYRTALKRKKLSSCTGAFLDTTLSTIGSVIFDYGCGRGDDVSLLKKSGYENVFGWDPHFFPDSKKLSEADFVTLSFVLNVIEDKDERSKTLLEAYSISSKALILSVMLDSQNTLQYAIPYNDGYISSISTFQKYYSPPEIEEYIYALLNTHPIRLANGVYIIFKDEFLQQDYLFKKQIGLLAQTIKQDTLFENDFYSTELVSQFSDLILSLGRLPKTDEITTELKAKINKLKISQTRLAKIAISTISVEELSEVRKNFETEILLFLSINMFDGRAKFSNLPPKLKTDVKAYFGSLTAANEKAQELLYSLKETEKLLALASNCERSGVGILAETKFKYHFNQFDKLPLELKLFCKIGERLHRNANQNDIIQLHLESKKVSFLITEDFDKSAIPRIAQREIISLSNNRLYTIDHQDKAQVRILYFKSHFMDEKDRNFLLQKAFDEDVRNTIFNDTEVYSMNFSEFAKSLFDNKLNLPQY